MLHATLLTSLANTIASNTPETIQLKIQIVLRSTKAQDEKQFELQTLTLAKAFMVAHPALPENWRNTPSCFKDLAHYFINADSIEAHAEKALCAWYLLLNQTIPADFPVEEIIALGTAYIAEPTQFAAFICWLLEKNVTPHVIDQKKLLQHYFHYNCCDFSEITRTYDLIKAFSENTASFLHYATTIPCLTKGYMNYTFMSGFRSYNVMGQFFCHDLELNISSIAKNTDSNALPLEILKNRNVMLFELFGFEFIKYVMKYPKEKIVDILSGLLNSKHKTTLLLEFPQKAFSGELDYQQTATLLNIISGTITPHPALIIEAIKLNPFYIHTEFALSTLPIELIQNAISELIKNKNAYTISHLPFLISLCKKIEPLPNEKNKVLPFILDCILLIGDALDEDIEDSIFMIKDYLIPFCEKKLKTYLNHIDEAISPFLDERTDYHAVKEARGMHLSSTNLMIRLFPELNKLTYYPYTIYDLGARVLEHYYARNKEKADLPTPSTILEKMSDDDAAKIRQMQEAIFSIISFDVVEWLLTDFPITDDWMLNALIHSHDINTSTTKNLLRSTKLTPQCASIAIIHFFNADYTKHNRLTLLKQNLQCLQPNALSSELTGLVFNAAIELPYNTDIINFICSIQDATKFPENFAHDSAMLTLQYGQWPLIRLLCGLSTTPINHAIFPKNNIALLLAVLEKRASMTLPPFLLKNELACEAYCLYENQNNIVHLAAQSGCLETVRSLVSFFEKHLDIEKINHILHAHNAQNSMPLCTDDHPNAGPINIFLTEKRTHYSNERKRTRTMPGFWHLKDDSSTDTESQSPEHPHKATRTDTSNASCEKLLNL